MLLHHARYTYETLSVEFACLDLILFFDPPETADAWSDWNQWRRIPQTAGDFGQRLEDAFQRLTAERYAGCIFVGTDAPELSRNDVAWAVQEIYQSCYAMIPAMDGGYVLLGIPAGKVSLFQGIAWGTSRVARQTRIAALRHGMVISELPALHDIDRYDDLIALIHRLNLLADTNALGTLGRRLAELATRK